MKLLAIETATESCSAALLDNQEIVAVSELAPRRHNEIILSMCESVLAQAETSLSQLDAIAFGRGPGSFTGVRLAASVTQGIAMGQDLPVVPVSSLAALAQAAHAQTQHAQVLACIDARMQEVYFGLYQVNSHYMQLVNEELVIAPNFLNIELNDDCYGAGSGWHTYAQELFQALGKEIAFASDVFPQAEFIAKLAVEYFREKKFFSAVEALPVYLRDNVAEKPKNKIVF
ncbi:MAG: tRNA (adenosine(37)-N6)-threonylcarbamoyltransferase complex dimerization subunit type 1 TsaB [Pseudomonadota bacterium]